MLLNVVSGFHVCHNTRNNSGNCGHCILKHCVATDIIQRVSDIDEACLSLVALMNIMHHLGIWPAIHIFRVEKYRPDKLDDLISHQDIINTSKSSDLFFLSSP